MFQLQLQQLAQNTHHLHSLPRRQENRVMRMIQRLLMQQSQHLQRVQYMLLLPS